MNTEDIENRLKKLTVNQLNLIYLKAVSDVKNKIIVPAYEWIIWFRLLKLEIERRYHG